MCRRRTSGAAVSVRKTQPFLLVLRTSVYSFRPFSEPAACWLQSKPLSSDGYSSCVYRLVAQRPIRQIKLRADAPCLAPWPPVCPSAPALVPGPAHVERHKCALPASPHPLRSAQLTDNHGWANRNGPRGQSAQLCPTRCEPHLAARLARLAPTSPSPDDISLPR